MTKLLSISHISKTFRSAGEHIPFLAYLHHVKDKEKKPNVLQDISFDVTEHSAFGIIGRNGSGKTTLLKIIAGIYDSDSGMVSGIEKTPLYLSGHSQGMNGYLSVRDNIVMRGIVLGVRRKKCIEYTPSIMSFAELGGLEDTPLYQLSSGMQARLAFSATIHFIEYINPSVILFDEVFSTGGDIAFKNKAKNTVENMIKNRTIIIVTHDLELVKEICDTIMIMKKGEIDAIGSPEKMIQKYERENG